MINLKQVMANFLDIVKAKQEANNKPTNQLTASEIEILLLLIKNSTFKGEHLESVYNVVLKLQDQYIQSTNKK